MEYINIKNFGAKGNGSADDSASIQRAINSLSVLIDKRRPIYFPPGTYKCESTINIPTDIQGIELIGAGWAESASDSTILRNESDGYLFQTTGSGTCAFFSVSNMKLLQSATSDYFFAFNNLTVNLHLNRLHMNLSNTSSGAILMNKVENHMNWIHDIKIVGNGNTVPIIHWDGPSDSNMSTTKFERVTINSPNSTAPQYLIHHKHINATGGFMFIQCNIEQPDGGGIHLYGINSAEFHSCIVSDTANQSQPTFLFDRDNLNQFNLEATFIQCQSFIGNATYPDVEIRNTPGTPGVAGPVNIIGSRFSHIKAGANTQFHRLSGAVSGFSGDGEINGMWLGALKTRGISNNMSITGVNRSRSLSGTASFVNSDTVTVSLQPSDPEADTNYRILLGPTINENFWVDEPSKTTTSFQIKSSNSSSNANITWMLVR